MVSRANQDPGLCKRLLEGHKRVLEAYGIKNLSSFRTDWFRRDDVLVIAVLSGDGERVLAGARLQPGLVANDFPLHQAVGLTWTRRWGISWNASFLRARTR